MILQYFVIYSALGQEECGVSIHKVPKNCPLLLPNPKFHAKPKEDAALLLLLKELMLLLATLKLGAKDVLDVIGISWKKREEVEVPVIQNTSLLPKKLKYITTYIMIFVLIILFLKAFDLLLKHISFEHLYYTYDMLASNP